MSRLQPIGDIAEDGRGRWSFWSLILPRRTVPTIDWVQHNATHKLCAGDPLEVRVRARGAGRLYCRLINSSGALPEILMQRSTPQDEFVAIWTVGPGQDGVWTVEARLVLLYDILVKTATEQVEIDTTPPSVTINPPPPPIVAQSALVITGSVEAGATVTGHAHSSTGDKVEQALPVSGTSFGGTLSLSDGTWSVWVVASDGCNTTQAPSVVPHTVIVLTRPPAVRQTSCPAVRCFALNDDVVVELQADEGLRGEFNLEPIAPGTRVLGPYPLQETTPGAYHGKHTVRAGDDGQYRIEGWVRNAAGISAPFSCPAPLTLDTVRPQVPVLSTSATLTRQPRPTIIANGTEPRATVKFYKGTGASAQWLGDALADQNGDGAAFTPQTDLSDGVHVFAARAQDCAGNLSAWSNPPLAIEIDTAPPLIDAVSFEPDGPFREGDAATLELQGDPGLEARAELVDEVTGQVFDSIAALAPSGGRGYSAPYPVRSTQAGRYLVRGRLTDRAGNEAIPKVAPRVLAILQTFPLPDGVHRVYSDGEDAGRWPSLLLDEHGSPHLAFLARHAGLERLVYARWDREGNAWRSTLIDEPVTAGLPPALALIDGRPIVSYGTRTGVKILDVLSRLVELDIPEADHNVTNNARLAVAGHDLLVAYVNGQAPKRVHIRRRRNGVWENALPIQEDPPVASEAARGIALAVDDAGTPYVSYFTYSSSNDPRPRQVFLWRVNYAGASPTADQLIRASLSVAQAARASRTALVLESSGKPHVIMKVGTEFKRYEPPGAQGGIGPDTLPFPLLVGDTVEPSAARLGDAFWLAWWHRVATSTPEPKGFLQAATWEPGALWSNPPNDIDRQDDADPSHGNVGHYSAIAVDQARRRVFIAYYSESEYPNTPTGHLKLWVATQP